MHVRYVGTGTRLWVMEHPPQHIALTSQTRENPQIHQLWSIHRMEYHAEMKVNTQLVAIAWTKITLESYYFFYYIKILYDNQQNYT